MQQDLSKRNLRLIQGIQQALEEDKLVLDYQPVMDLKNPDKPIFMLSCRMQDTSGRLLAHGTLRQLTAAAELDLKLDRWLVLKGLKNIKKLRRSDPGASIFIPLSGASLASRGFSNWLSIQQDLHDFPGGGMILSFRLSELSRDIHAAHECISEVHKLNIRVSLRKFSDNPAALKVLQLLRAEYIEIPPRLLLADKIIIDRILYICHKLGVGVVLCDINTANEVSLEWSTGASMLMGNYIQPPTNDMKFHFPVTL